MNDPFAIHDVWLAAVNALPDPRPLAALLRSDTPITTGARHLLAELLHPGDPPLTNQRLVLRHNPDFDRMIRQFSVTVNYRRALADGTPARKAAKAAGKQAGVTERQAFRWIEKSTPERLHDRLRGSADIFALSNVSKVSDGGVVDDELANNLVLGAMSLPG